MELYLEIISDWKDVEMYIICKVLVVVYISPAKDFLRTDIF